MKKTSLLFIIGLLLFSTYTQILARRSCKSVSDCNQLKCEKRKCVQNKCICVAERNVVLPPSNNNEQACFDYCKSIGEEVRVWTTEGCWCQKPPM
ncbi:hypothetical protein EUTSA_v10002741mg [Eutrema salsugineum]|uniref:Uncharacterized protein n=1 Tax=Eutrema salsugineum TaxID=72664 RepID=V4L5I9_EUTSA|nr:hypothetical protein EUTSA_v10002741mg [Eutrema salsugineum]